MSYDYNKKTLFYIVRNDTNQTICVGNGNNVSLVGTEDGIRHIYDNLYRENGDYEIISIEEYERRFVKFLKYKELSEIREDLYYIVIKGTSIKVCQSNQILVGDKDGIESIYNKIYKSYNDYEIISVKNYEDKFGNLSKMNKD